ncbi:histidine kinase, partial [Streptomyces sp. TRM76130]|nr:histidine kinase [Streptomyces sp. TRM76130]
GAAFDALQRTAVELAEEDVRLHQGINQLFVNLARRSQVLIHRQLSLLDVMERHEEDANALDRLFELDQLATRMRRYAEGLLIVSGSAPGR